MSDLRITVRRRVATITLNRPRVLNALRTQTLRELDEAVSALALDDRVAVLVVTGAGRAFSSGGDLDEFRRAFTRRPRDFWKLAHHMQRAFEGLMKCGKPVIARVNGPAIGGGHELMLACDLAVAAEHAVFGQVGPAIGSVPALGGTQWLPLLVGDRRAREMVMLTPRLTAAQALEWGLVNRVVPADRLDDAVDELVRRLLSQFPDCLRHAKSQLNYWKLQAWGATAPLGQDWLTEHFHGDEPRRGAEKFLARRS